jgi:hypothetical protein
VVIIFRIKEINIYLVPDGQEIINAYNWCFYVYYVSMGKKAEQYHSGGQQAIPKDLQTTNKK